jgi:hypothetical protein
MTLNGCLRHTPGLSGFPYETNEQPASIGTGLLGALTTCVLSAQTGRNSFAAAIRMLGTTALTREQCGMMTERAGQSYATAGKRGLGYGAVCAVRTKAYGSELRDNSDSEPPSNLKMLHNS